MVGVLGAYGEPPCLANLLRSARSTSRSDSEEVFFRRLPYLARAIYLQDFMVSKETQAVIGKFGVDKYGQPLFYPDADKTDADLGLQ